MQVFPTVDGLDVFVNQAGSITLRQQSYDRSDESLIVIPVGHINATIRALRSAAKEAKAGVFASPEQSIKCPTDGNSHA